ncbi:hypothetical protein GMA11_06510 [Granulicatella sp. zg-ZJ]|uniref:hypothetical protein n=1 Tax=unclassified Granulicatella TaxID=2630493 RepID=UPI0013C0B8AB|nr:MULTISPECIES: hypothetical protein [unclassified Granulicatella]MBS4749859.1 hypothetical protein [Carnobacteriaceae bacterium zg-ZUI78]NEW63045.1 hypothetical protein [Granulicatella sp. zg-ZJ]NEW66202.1 hypothetical protein [Granulicatella sp. zg-84]QMI85953.1 hypothetical protein H1220_00860 [Carnobacteriaceae bacterium zg-84]
MKKIYLALTIFKQQKWLNLLICLELAFMFSLFNIVLNRTDNMFQNEAVLTQSGLQKSINFAPISRHIDDIGLRQRLVPQVERILEKYDFVEGVSTFEEVSVQTSKDTHGMLLYDALTVEKVYPILNTERDKLPVIAISNGNKVYQVGDTIKAMIDGKEKILTVVQSDDIAKLPLFWSQGGRNYLGDTTMIFQNIIQGRTILLGRISDELRGKVNPYEENIMVYIKPDTEMTKVRALQSELSQLGQADIVSDMIQKTQELNADKVKKDLINMVVVVFASVIGMFSVSVLNVYQQLRRFSIWHMCGATLKEIGIIYTLYMCLIGVLSILCFAGLMILGYVSDGRGHYYFYYINPSHLVTMIGIVSIMVFVTLGCSLLALKKQGVFQYYYE